MATVPELTMCAVKIVSAAGVVISEGRPVYNSKVLATLVAMLLVYRLGPYAHAEVVCGDAAGSTS